MQISRTSGPVGLMLMVAVSFLMTMPAAAQWNSGNLLSIYTDSDDVWTIVLEPPGGAFDTSGFRLPSISLPELPGYTPPPPDGGGDPYSVLLPPPPPEWPYGGGEGGRPSLEIPIALPNPPDLDRPPTRPSSPVPEPSAALLFGLGTVVVGNVSRRRRADRD